MYTHFFLFCLGLVVLGPVSGKRWARDRCERLRLDNCFSMLRNNASGPDLAFGPGLAVF